MSRLVYEKDPAAQITERMLTTICLKLGVPAPLAQTLHAALRKDEEQGFAKAVLYHLRRPRRPHAHDARLDVCLDGPLDPARMVPYIESLHDRGLLTRCEATALQDGWLSLAGRDGHWYWKGK